MFSNHKNLKMSFKRTARGFTLIELLVVVLIIGILAAIALPMYTRSVEKSRAVEAYTNLRYIVQEMQMYIMANGVAKLAPQGTDRLSIIDAIPKGATAVTVSNIKSWQTDTFTYLPNGSATEQNPQARRRPEVPSYIISANIAAPDWGHVTWLCQSCNAAGAKACEALGGKLLHNDIIGTVNATYAL